MTFDVRGTFDSRQLMNQNRKLRKEIIALKDLAMGCEEHPQNRYQRSPKSECAKCQALFELAKRVNLWPE